MILIAGGTGQLGRRIVHLLTARGIKVRILTRNPNRTEVPHGELIEVVSGDVRDLRSVERAMHGVDSVVSAIHGFTGTNGCDPETIDHLGNRNLIQAAKTQGVNYMVLVSVYGASANHPLELFRMKYLAEQEVRASGLDWTIIRPTAYMETWARLIGEPLLTSGKTRLFGRGRNPINFVSTCDVARVVVQAVVDPSLRGQIVEIGGPENLSAREVVEIFTNVTGKTGSTRTTPIPMMRVMSVIARPVNPTLARQIQAGILMDTTDQTFDASEAQQRFPDIELTTLREMIRRDYIYGSGANCHDSQ
jgi:uncharacterized protein YbjT (DUF2867 family)